MDRNEKIILVIVVLAAVLIILNTGATFWDTYHHEPLRDNTLSEYRSNGEQIFVTGTNEKGERIPFTGGPHWLYTHGGGCANCHGEDGRGGIYPMMCDVKTPDIRYSTLVEMHGMSEEDIKRAITQGVDDEGDELDYCMPRWQMDEKDLNDLIEYLKQL